MYMYVDSPKCEEEYDSHEQTSERDGQTNVGHNTQSRTSGLHRIENSKDVHVFSNKMKYIHVCRYAA